MKIKLNPIRVRYICLVALTGMLAGMMSGALSGCHIVLGPDEGYQEWWYYCDETECYRCNANSCEITDGSCVDEETCQPPRPVPGCITTSQCEEGFACLDGRCIPLAGPCTDDSSCGDGAYCSNGSCENSGLCSEDADCSRFGDHLVCDARGTCVPGDLPVQSCQSGDTCPDGLCVDARCGTCSGDCGGGTTCQFDRHCGSGRACLDGRCTNVCSDSVGCGSGQVCTGGVCVVDSGRCSKSSDCGAGEVCVNTTCFEDCTASGTCSSSSDLCSPPILVGDTDIKVCFADHNAQLECTFTKDCTGGELCVNGICRTSCTDDDACAACEDGPVCGPGGFCMTAQEASPQCASSDECLDGEVCLNAACVSL